MKKKGKASSRFQICSVFKKYSIPSLVCILYFLLFDWLRTMALCARSSLKKKQKQQSMEAKKKKKEEKRLPKTFKPSIGLFLAFPVICFIKGGKKKRKSEPLIFFVAFMQHFLTWVPHHCTTKSVSFKSSFVFCLSSQKNGNLRLNSVEDDSFLSSIEKQQMVRFQHLSLKASNFNKNKTPKQVLKKFRKLPSKRPHFSFLQCFVNF